MTECDYAWAAGFFDGEGHIAYKRAKRNDDPQRYVYQTIILDIRQKDRRVLDRFQATFEVGKIYGPYHNKRVPESSYWCYAVSKSSDVIKVIELMRPYLSPVKVQQSQSAIDAWIDRPRLKTGRKPKAVAA